MSDREHDVKHEAMGPEHAWTEPAEPPGTWLAEQCRLLEAEEGFSD